MVVGPYVELTAGDAEFRLSRFEPAIAISASGDRVAAIVGDSASVMLFDATSGKELKHWTLDASSVQFLPDGRVLARDRDKLHVLSEDGTDTPVWDADDWALASPDGAWIASMLHGELSIRSLNGAPRVLARGMRSIQTMVFAPDGTRLCVITNQSYGDTPAGDTLVTIYDRDSHGWRRTATQRVEGAGQEDDAAFLSRDSLLLDASIVDLRTGRATPSGTPVLQAVSVDGRVLLFHDDTGTHQQWAPITGGQFGPLLEVGRPRPVIDRGYAMTISSRGHVVWCAGALCVVGPPAT